MNWAITEADQLTSQDVDRQGIKLLIGNGYLGYRGTLEEYTKEQKTATIVAGLYDQVGDQWREPVNLPNGCFTRVIHNGAGLHALASQVVAHSQTLYLYGGVHERWTTFACDDGTRIIVRARRFTSLARRQVIGLEYCVSSDRPCEVTIRTGIDGDVWDINGPHLRQMHAGEEGGVLSVSALTHERSLPVAVSECVTYPAGQPASVSIVVEGGQEGRPASIYRDIRAAVDRNGFTFYKFVAHVTGVDDPAPLEASRAICRQVAGLGFQALLGEHTALWRKRWQACDVQIEGDPEAQLALRFSLYQLLSMVPTHTSRASIPARGISGQMYKGAIFWDTEIFILPFFNHAFPAYSRNLLLYRYHTLDGARRKAAEYGYRGAFYAWESQDTGDDACTLFNVTDVFTNRPMRTYFRDKQVHISADIAYAFWAYYLGTGDASIWRDGGAEVVFECARFFLSCVYYHPDRKRYELLDVTGPDEYHERVHNNAFTNRLAAHTLEVCLKVAELMQRNEPDFYAGLVRRLDFARDLDSIGEVARGLFLPDEVAPGEVIPQFDGYFGLEDVPLKALLARKLHPHEYLGGGCGLATTTQIIKQADVVLMLYLFGERYPLETKKANWEYYEPRTEHGSSLSACSYSLIAAQVGKVEWAYRYFLKTATIDLTGEGKQYVGTLYIGGTHAAACGGAWMSAVFGLCGIRWTGEALSVDPHLPAHWRMVSLPFVVRGCSLRITLTAESVAIAPAGRLAEPLTVTVRGSEYLLRDDEELAIALKVTQRG